MIPDVLTVVYRNSLFSGNVKSKHVRSGKSNQWKNSFKPIHKRRFVELFDDALIKLGYEADNEWASQEGEVLSALHNVEMKQNEGAT